MFIEPELYESRGLLRSSFGVCVLAPINIRLLTEP